MSQKAVADFLKKIDEDATLRKEFLTAVPKKLSSGAPIVEFAGRQGFEFTEQELNQAAAIGAGTRELSEAALDAVAGGMTGPIRSHRPPGHASEQIHLSWETHEIKV